MLNSINFIGRLTKNPIADNNSEKTAVRFTLAQKSRSKSATQPVLIICRAYGKTAELALQYLKKGSQVGITGRIDTYIDSDNKLITSVVVEQLSFCGTSDKQEMPTSQNSANEWHKQNSIADDEGTDIIV